MESNLLKIFVFYLFALNGCIIPYISASILDFCTLFHTDLPKIQSDIQYLVSLKLWDLHKVWRI